MSRKDGSVQASRCQHQHDHVFETGEEPGICGGWHMGSLKQSRFKQSRCSASIARETLKRRRCI